MPTGATCPSEPCQLRWRAVIWSNSRASDEQLLARAVGTWLLELEAKGGLAWGRGSHPRRLIRMGEIENTAPDWKAEPPGTMVRSEQFSGALVTEARDSLLQRQGRVVADFEVPGEKHTRAFLALS